MYTNIILRLANVNDMSQIFHWRNDENVRKWSLSASEIDWETHQAWFKNTLENPNRELLIAMNISQPLGVVRLDKDHDEIELSIYLVPTFIGKGLGEAIIRSGVQRVSVHFPTIKKITAKVLLENIASQKVFSRAGFIEHHRWFEQGHEKGIWYHYDLQGKNNEIR